MKSIRRSSATIEIDAYVTDADGTSVSYEPIVMGPRTSVAAVSAILQNHVSGMARNMVKRGMVVPESAAITTPPDDQSLVGQAFTATVLA